MSPVQQVPPQDQPPQPAVPRQSLLPHISNDVMNFTFYLLLAYTLWLYYIMIIDVLTATPWAAAHLPFTLPPVKGISAGTADFYLVLIIGYGGTKQVKKWRKVLRLSDLPETDVANIERQSRWLTAGAMLANGWVFIAMAATILDALGHMTRIPGQLTSLAYKSFLFFLATKTSGSESVALLKHRLAKTRVAAKGQPAGEPATLFEENEEDNAQENGRRVTDEDRQRVLAHLKGGVLMDKEDCEKLTGLSSSQVERLIRGLKNSQLILKIGEGKGAKYRLNEGPIQ